MIPEGRTPTEVADLIQDIIKDKVVCDVGCGLGDFMLDMSRYAKEVFGIEENRDWAIESSEKGFDTICNNIFYEPLPKADVYYIWNRYEMGIFLKAKYEKTKGIFILGHSIRPSTEKFLNELKAEVREINGFKVYITKI